MEKKRKCCENLGCRWGVGGLVNVGAEGRKNTQERAAQNIIKII